MKQKHRKAIVKKSIDLLWQVPLQERLSSRRCSRSLWFPGDKNKSHAGKCRSGSGWGHSLKQQGAVLLVLIYQLMSPPTELSGMFPPNTTSISSKFNSCMSVLHFYRWICKIKFITRWFSCDTKMRQKDLRLSLPLPLVCHLARSFSSCRSHRPPSFPAAGHLPQRRFRSCLILACSAPW